MDNFSDVGIYLIVFCNLSNSNIKLKGISGAFKIAPRNKRLCLYNDIIGFITVKKLKQLHCDDLHIILSLSAVQIYHYFIYSYSLLVSSFT